MCGQRKVCGMRNESNQIKTSCQCCLLLMQAAAHKTSTQSTLLLLGMRINLTFLSSFQFLYLRIHIYNTCVGSHLCECEQFTIVSVSALCVTMNWIFHDLFAHTNCLCQHLLFFCSAEWGKSGRAYCFIIIIIIQQKTLKMLYTMDRQCIAIINDVEKLKN